jgi:transposase
MSERRVYSLEYKLEAVKLICEKGLSARQVADDLGVEVSNIRRWKKQYGDQPLENVAVVSAEMKEIGRLQEQVRRLKIERDILKKATAIFAKGNQ